MSFGLDQSIGNNWLAREVKYYQAYHIIKDLRTLFFPFMHKTWILSLIYLVGSLWDLLLDWSTKLKRPLSGTMGRIRRSGSGWGTGAGAALWGCDMSTLLIGVLCRPWSKSPRARGSRQKPNWNGDNAVNNCVPGTIQVHRENYPDQNGWKLRKMLFLAVDHRNQSDQGQATQNDQNW